MSTILSNVGSALLDAILMPGERLITTFAELVPGIASGLGVETDAAVPIVVTLVTYCLLALAAFLTFRVLRTAARNAGALIRTFLFRGAESLRGVRTRIVLKLRQLFPRRAVNGFDLSSTVDFDDLDMAVLRSASARSPSLAISAPDIAEMYTLRPAQVQRSLDKLCRNKMLESVIGSTDGYENYRLSGLGAAFVASCSRRGQ